MISPDTDFTEPAADTSSATIDALIAHQGETPDERFCRRWLPGVSASTWSRLKRGVYAAKDQSAVVAKLEAGLRGIEEAASARRANRSGRVLPLSTVKRVAEAVRLAEHEDRDRFVVFLADTGGGKSKMAAWLSEMYHGRATLVEATETWRDSYLTACLGIAEAVVGSGHGRADKEATNLTAIIGDSPNRRKVEKALIAELRGSGRILIIDEAHYFGATTINLVKALLNHCPNLIVVGLAIPALWERMSRSAWAEADQLRNRAKVIIRCQALPAEDIRVFLADRLGEASFTAIEAERPELVAAFAEACKWGLWAEAERLADDALDLAGDEAAPSADDLAAAISGRKAAR